MSGLVNEDLLLARKPSTLQRSIYGVLSHGLHGTSTRVPNVQSHCCERKSPVPVLRAIHIDSPESSKKLVGNDLSVSQPRVGSSYRFAVQE